MDVAIIGAGSLGSLVGGLLASEHDVTLVGRPEHMEAVERSGLQIVGQFDRTIHPAVRTEISGLDADIGLVTVKAYDTRSVADALARTTIETIVSLQNGMGNEDQLAATCGDRIHVLGGTATYGARMRTPGVVACTGQGRIEIGPYENTNRVTMEQARSIATAFGETDLNCEFAADMRRRLWIKLAVNAGVNPITALSRCRNGVLINGPAGGLALEAARETAAVARSNGISLSDPTVTDELTRVVENTANNRSSMAVDCANERRTEIDAINGYVVDQAESVAHVPVNNTLATLVQTWEYSCGLRDDTGAPSGIKIL